MATEKYHITKSGDGVAICRAQDGNCPLGGEHFDKPGDAFKHLEASLAAANPDVLTGSKKNSSRELVESGADAKVVRDALRAEHPEWGSRQIHAVYQRMVDNFEAGGPQLMVGEPGTGKTKVVKIGKTPSPSVPSQEQVDKLKKGYSDALGDHEKAILGARKYNEEITRYDSLNGATEGRAYYYGPNGKTKGVNASGKTYFEPTGEQQAGRRIVQDKIEETRLFVELAQTNLEEAGLGHLIPDDGNVLRVYNQAQKWLVEHELKGQISDGMWENTNPPNHWQAWCDAKVVVDPANVGRNFYASKDNYQLNSKELVSIVGDEMKSTVETKTKESYSDNDLARDLKELRSIFKTLRPRLEL